MNVSSLPRSCFSRSRSIPRLQSSCHFFRSFHFRSRVASCYVWGAANEVFPEASGHRAERLKPKLFPFQSSRPMRLFSIGGHHCAILTEDGKIYTGGRGEFYELGNGKSAKNVEIPKLLTNLPPMADVAVGLYHTIALSEDGQVFTCGWGGSLFNWGCLGHGDKQSRGVLTPIDDLKDEKIVHVASGKDHALCLSEKGEIFAFGRGEFGRLGTAGSGNEITPVKLTALEGIKIVGISAGSSFSAAVSSSGHLYTWGRNDAGQLGHGIGLMMDTHSMENVPTRVQFDYESVNGIEENVQVVQVACGHRHMIALTNTGRVWLFGQRTWMKPVAIRGDDEQFLKEKIISVAAGKNMSAAVSSDGRVFSWGDGRSGQLGHGDKAAKKNPTPIREFGARREFGRAIRVTAGGSEQIAVFTEDKN